MKTKHIIYFPNWVRESVELENNPADSPLENNPAASLFNNLPNILDKISSIEKEDDAVEKFKKVKEMMDTSSNNLTKLLKGGALDTPEGDADTVLIVKWMFVCNMLIEKKVFPGYISESMDKVISALDSKMRPLLTIKNKELFKYASEVSKFKTQKLASIAEKKKFEPLLIQYGLTL